MTFLVEQVIEGNVVSIEEAASPEQTNLAYFLKHYKNCPINRSYSTCAILVSETYLGLYWRHNLFQLSFCKRTPNQGEQCVGVKRKKNSIRLDRLDTCFAPTGDSSAPRIPIRIESQFLLI
ncbi:hypothetical protein HELRODRAFT_168098 [Helobdella robusta]|uniref:Uncharacterized protein n=1 Tax=Helobdella robusta TaxID=6412 RepID=T1F059_HELRO|nr:hypothetical protein HELRODRAFT_168098 [Helobdella robusta]ESO10215.1 hypothetical protein HELRODRAFT_168098 [Helobdella robusta]